MQDGNVERRRPNERDPTIVVFDRYAFDLTRLAPAPQLVIGLREKYLWELLFPKADDNALKTSPGQFRVELHERLIAPLYPLAFGVIAFAVLGFPRTTRQSRNVSLIAVIAGVAALRLGGFCRHGNGGQFPAGAGLPLRSNRHHPGLWDLPDLARPVARNRRKGRSRHQGAERLSAHRELVGERSTRAPALETVQTTRRGFEQVWGTLQLAVIRQTLPRATFRSIFPSRDIIWVCFSSSAQGFASSSDTDHSKSPGARSVPSSTWRSVPRRIPGRITIRY
jgi:hypothetical protein